MGSGGASCSTPRPIIVNRDVCSPMRDPCCRHRSCWFYNRWYQKVPVTGGLSGAANGISPRPVSVPDARVGSAATKPDEAPVDTGQEGPRHGTEPVTKGPVKGTVRMPAFKINPMIIGRDADGCDGPASLHCFPLRSSTGLAAVCEPQRFNLPPLAADDSDIGDDGNQQVYHAASSNSRCRSPGSRDRRI